MLHFPVHTQGLLTGPHCLRRPGLPDLPALPGLASLGWLVCLVCLARLVCLPGGGLACLGCLASLASLARPGLLGLPAWLAWPTCPGHARQPSFAHLAGLACLPIASGRRRKQRTSPHGARRLRDLDRNAGNDFTFARLAVVSGPVPRVPCSRVSRTSPVQRITVPTSRNALPVALPSITSRDTFQVPMPRCVVLGNAHEVP